MWSSARSPELLRQALVAGAVVDAIDVLSVGLGLLEGNLNAASVAWVGGGAAAFLAIQLWALRGLRG